MTAFSDISIHAPRAGCDCATVLVQNKLPEFQSTHPVRGATTYNRLDSQHKYISIHAPRAGCDQLHSHQHLKETISIHAPRAGCDSLAHFCDVKLTRFQSTHPVRGATFSASTGPFRSGNFNPRTPCGVRPADDKSATFRHYFNPRTPCGVRQRRHIRAAHLDIFQSTHPVRGATSGCGGKHQRLPIFQSTHPVRGATAIPDNAVYCLQFQSTHPVRGATSTGCRCPARSSHFNPRTPCGVRRRRWCASDSERNFNPRTPCGVRPAVLPPSVKSVLISIHAPRAGCDGKFDDFNPLNLHKRYKRVLDRPKSTSEQGKNKAKLAYIHVFTVLGGCEGAGTVCALLLRTQYY